MFYSARRWWGDRTPNQQVAIVAALITATSGFLGTMVQAAPSLLAAARNWQYPNFSAHHSQPVIVGGVAIGPAEPFTANVYPRRIVRLISPAESINSKIYLPPGEHALGGQVAIAFTVSSNSAFPVTISDIKAIKTCQALTPAGETLFFLPNGYRNQADHGLYYNLDNPDPVAQNILKNGSHGGPYFIGHPVTLKRHEQHTFAIHVSSSLFCQFVFHLTVATQLGVRLIEVSNYGEPFYVSGLIHKRDQPCNIRFSRYSVVYTLSLKDSVPHWYRVSSAGRDHRSAQPPEAHSPCARFSRRL